MKKILFALILTIATLSMQAQPQRRGGEGKGSPQEFQIALIARQLQLTDQQKETFSELYTQYSNELAGLRVRPNRGGGQPTDEQIEAQILESFDKAEQSTTLKREYYYKFKEILTPHQILRVYNIEREFQERLNAEHQRRNGGGGGGGGANN